MVADPHEVLSRYAAAAARQSEATGRLLDAVQRLEALADGEDDQADWLDRRSHQVRFPGPERRDEQ